MANRDPAFIQFGKWFGGRPPAPPRVDEDDVGDVSRHVASFTVLVDRPSYGSIRAFSPRSCEYACFSVQ